MERTLLDIAKKRKQGSQYPRVTGRVRMSLHGDAFALKNVPDMAGMGRVDLGVLGCVEIVGIVALDSLVEERNSQQKYEENNCEPLAQRINPPLLTS